MAGKFKLVVKNGDTKYGLNKSGQYVGKPVDLVQEFDDFASALSEFLYSVTDEYTDETVSLTFKPSKKK